MQNTRLADNMIPVTRQPGDGGDFPYSPKCPACVNVEAHSNNVHYKALGVNPPTRPSWLIAEPDILAALTLLAEIPTASETPGIAARDEDFDNIIGACRRFIELYK